MIVKYIGIARGSVYDSRGRSSAIDMARASVDNSGVP